MEPFYQYLKACRQKRRLTIESVSQATDISRSLIYQYETNRSFPSGKNLIKLARFYEFSLDELFQIFPRSPMQPSVYDSWGHMIQITDFPTPIDADYYQLSANTFVLVSHSHHYRVKEALLAYQKDKADIFYLLNDNNHFFLIDSKGQLYPYDSKEIKIIGPILQYLKLTN